jgi:aspartyl-tRNA(Asn)/glutamyl-tRNA(Gln) amidotransferase subunit C
MSSPSPTFDRAAIEHLAKLAALSLTEEEIHGLAGELQAIVAYVEELSAVDTSSVSTAAATGEAIGDSPGWRDDVVREGLTRQEALAAAPHATETGFAVPAFVSVAGGSGR